MKESLLLRKTVNNNFLPIKNGYHNSLSSLFSLLFGDFRPWDDNFLYHDINVYNAHFIYHDFDQNMLYLGIAEWELSDGEMHCPEDHEFPTYVHENNSCKMSVDNYLEFRKNWVNLKQELPSFALIYRDNNDWIHIKSFNLQEDMEFFVKNSTQQDID